MRRGFLALKPGERKPERRAFRTSYFVIIHHSGKAFMNARQTSGIMSPLMSLHVRQAKMVTRPPADAGTT